MKECSAIDFLPKYGQACLWSHMGLSTRDFIKKLSLQLFRWQEMWTLITKSFMTRIVLDIYFLYVLPKKSEWALISLDAYDPLPFCDGHQGKQLIFLVIFDNAQLHVSLDKNSEKSICQSNIFCCQKMRTKIVINAPKGTALLDFYPITQNFKLDKKNR